MSKSNVVGQGLKEAIGINQSLTCLGRVIDGLVKGDKHVPYRDSVLTQILSDSLGGNSRTTMLIALSPAAINYDETVSTLRYGSRARQIVNVVKVNEDPTATLIRELQDELARIKEDIRTGNVNGLRRESGLRDSGDLDRSSSTLSPSRVPSSGGLQAKEREAQHVEQMLHEVQVREQVAQARVVQHEQVWAEERRVITQQQQVAVHEMQAEKVELMRQRCDF